MRTAYEMRSSDWSSDVCSSDLWHLHLQPGQRQQPDVGGAERIRRQCLVSLERGVALVGHADLALPVLIQTFDSSNANGRGNPAVFFRRCAVGRGYVPDGSCSRRAAPHTAGRGYAPDARGSKAVGGVRSEEHTSELQSLMRNSYALFCLKKKK